MENIIYTLPDDHDGESCLPKCERCGVDMYEKSDICDRCDFEDGQC